MTMHWSLSQPLVNVLRAGHCAGVLRSPKPEPETANMFVVFRYVCRSHIVGKLDTPTGA